MEGMRKELIGRQIAVRLGRGRKLGTGLNCPNLDPWPVWQGRRQRTVSGNRLNPGWDGDSSRSGPMGAIRASGLREQFILITDQRRNPRGFCGKENETRG